ncbi:MAG TPA: hypothetical protein VGX23_34615 [Actinocrinis sp.]|nr:hypothetical protein [Actinocrinis sp.]
MSQPAHSTQAAEVAEPAQADAPVRFAPVPPIGAGGNLLAEIDAWLTSEALRALVQAFGGDPDLPTADRTGRIAPPDRRDLLTRIDRLYAFTDRWDVRQGRERNLVGDLELTPSQRDLAKSAGEALGLRGPEILRFDHYDHVLMLGGLIRACLARPATAALLLRPGTVPGRTITAGTITALGGHRPFAGDEFDQATREGLADVTEEYQAQDAGTRRAFGLGEPSAVEHHDSDLPGGTWGIRTYQWQPPHGGPAVPVRVVAAPSSEPGLRRANTPDSYAFFAARIADLAPGAKLLLLSTAIHVLPQHLAALRMLGLPYRAQIDTVSARAGSVPGMPLANFTPTKYLLEIRSTIRILQQLVTEL